MWESICTINSTVVFTVCVLAWFSELCVGRVIIEYSILVRIIIIIILQFSILCKYHRQTLDMARAERPNPPLHILTCEWFVPIDFFDCINFRYWPRIANRMPILFLKYWRVFMFTVHVGCRRKWSRACIYGIQFYLHTERNQIEIENIFVSVKKVFCITHWSSCAVGGSGRAVLFLFIIQDKWNSD